MAGVERTVRMGSMAYLDPDGRMRRADCGATVLVHPDAVERFDRLNVLAGQEPAEQPSVEPETAPKRTRTRKED